MIIIRNNRQRRAIQPPEGGSGSPLTPDYNSLVDFSGTANTMITM